MIEALLMTAGGNVYTPPKVRVRTITGEYVFIESFPARVRALSGAMTFLPSNPSRVRRIAGVYVFSPDEEGV